VPVGTEVHKIKTKLIGNSIIEERIKIADLDQAGEEFCVATGGIGGEGNHKRKTKQLRSRGLPGENLEYELRLKLIADVGFVGYPNAGKSTLLTAVSLYLNLIFCDS
jgi:GTP-binding protein